MPCLLRLESRSGNWNSLQAFMFIKKDNNVILAEKQSKTYEPEFCFYLLNALFNTWL